MARLDRRALREAAVSPDRFSAVIFRPNLRRVFSASVVFFGAHSVCEDLMRKHQGDRHWYFLDGQGFLSADRDPLQEYLNMMDALPPFLR